MKNKIWGYVSLVSIIFKNNQNHKCFTNWANPYNCGSSTLFLRLWLENLKNYHTCVNLNAYIAL